MLKMRREKKIYWMCVLLLVGVYSCNSDKPSFGDVAIQDVYNDFLSCHDTTSTNYSCNSFVAKAVCVEFGITDFQEGEGFMTESQLVEVVKNSGSWKVLGGAEEAGVLLEAHEKVENGKAVIVFNPNKKHSGIAIVRKGDMVFSRSWNMDCPNSAFFHQVQPERSFLRKSLAYCFSKPEGLVVYAK